MSRAEKFRRKNHKKIAYGKLEFKCPVCGMVVPDSAFEQPDFGINYKCTVCGAEVFNALKERLHLKVKEV